MGRKAEYARTLFRQSSEATSTSVQRAVKEKFGCGMGSYSLLRIMHEVRGTKSKPRKKKKVARKAKAKAKKIARRAKKTATKKPRRSKPKHESNSLVPIPVTIETQSSVNVLIRALVRAMRDEGLESLTIRADGRGRAFQLVGRDLDVGV